MALGSGELAQIVWAETKDLPPGRADGSGDANGIRRLVAQLAASLDGAGFDKRASLPPVSDRVYGDTARAVMAIAETAKDAGQPQSRLIFWEAGDNTVRPSAGATPPPAPWSTMLADGITYQGRHQLAGGRVVDIFSRAPLDGDADGAPFVNATTGTGMPGGKPLIAPQTRIISGNRRVGFWVFIVAVLAFTVAAVWSYGVGVASRLTFAEFQQTASVNAPAAGTQANCEPTLAKDIVALGPPNWRSQADKTKDCRTLYAKAQQDVAKGMKREDTLLERFAALALRWAGSSGWSVSLTLPLVLAFAALTLLFVSSGYAIVGRPLGAIIDERNRISLTLAQLAMWSIVILAGWLVFGLYNFGFGALTFEALDQLAVSTAAQGDNKPATDDNEFYKALVNAYNLFPGIPYSLMGVLGLAGATPIMSRLISKTALVGPTQADAPVKDSKPPVPAYLRENSDPSQADLSDMVVSETASSNLVDTSRVQHIAITGILVISYAMLLFDAVSAIDAWRIVYAAVQSKSVFINMPAVDGTFVSLLAVSHATLLGAKFYEKKTEGSTVKQ
jgi:hypothetical protein